MTEESQRMPLTCEEVETLLPLACDGSLDPSCSADVFEHIASCESCQDALAAHDLITMALADGHTPAPEKRPAEIIQFSLPKPVSWAMAAGVLVSAGALSWMAMSERSTHSSSVPQITAAAPTVKAEIIQVIESDKPGGEPTYLVRQGDKVFVVGHDHLDGGNEEALAVPSHPAANLELRPRQ